MKRLSLLWLISSLYFFMHSMENQSIEDHYEQKYAEIHAMVVLRQENELLLYLHNLATVDPLNIGTSVYCALEYALSDDNEKLVQLLCQNFLKITQTESYKGLIHLAAIKNNKKLMRYFIDHGASIDSFSLEGNAPIHYAIDFDSKDVLKELVEVYGCDVNLRSACEGEQYTPLELAIFLGDVEMYNYLVNKGASINSVLLGRNALHIAAENSLQLTELLLQEGLNCNEQDVTGATPLHYAIRKIDEASNRIKQLIKSGAVVSLPDQNGDLPLMALFDYFINPLDEAYDDDHIKYMECAKILSVNMTLSADQALSMLSKCFTGLHGVDKEDDHLFIRKFMQLIVRSLDLRVDQLDSSIKTKINDWLKRRNPDQPDLLSVSFKEAINSITKFIETRDYITKSLLGLKSWTEALGLKAYIAARHNQNIEDFYNPPAYKQLLIHAIENNNIILIHFCSAHLNIAYNCDVLNPLQLALDKNRFDIAGLLISLNRNLFSELVRKKSFNIENVLKAPGGVFLISGLSKLVPYIEDSFKENLDPETSVKKIQSSSPDKKRRKSLSPEK